MPDITISSRAFVRTVSIIAIVALIIVGTRSFLSVIDKADVPDGIDTSAYQAVILENGTIYFGHLKDGEDGFYVLEDAYFVRDVEGRRKVLSVHDEFHGPENVIYIPSHAVTAIENLRSDSSVAKAIAALAR